MTTKELELKLYKAVACKNGKLHLIKLGTYFCFEVAIPHCAGIVKKRNRERVDAICLEKHKLGDIWRCYELKVSKADFKSTAALSFYGHYNYFVMPAELYEKVKDEIPKEIGVYIADDVSCRVVKKPTKCELIIPHDKLLFALMQGFARQAQKLYRKAF